MTPAALALLLAAAPISGALAKPGDAVQARMTEDAAAGRPLIAHLHVALCDNKHQGIARVHDHLGNGQDPRSNLYWGALYGVRNFLHRKAGWRKVRFVGQPPEGVLERAVFKKQLRRNGKRVTAYVIADAWDGRLIKNTIAHFLKTAGGNAVEQIKVGNETLSAGGAAHLTAYVGHNGLMEFSVAPQKAAPQNKPKSAMVLACASREYFEDSLRDLGAHSLLLTTNLMAPEAYTINAALQAWFSGASTRSVHRAAADTYSSYQKYPKRVGRKLFWTAP